MEFGNFVAVSDEDDAGAVDEQAVLDDARDVTQFAREHRRIGDAAEIAVENVVAFVGDEGLSVFLANDYGGAELLDFAADKRQCEGDDFDGHGEAAEHRNLLAGVGDDDEFARGGRHHFFIEERAAAAFDQVELRVEFVGAVDGDVNVLDFVKAGEGDAEFSGHLARVDRGGDAADFEAGLDAITDELDCISGRRAGAEADNLAVLNELKGGARGGFFFLFVGHGWGLKFLKNPETNVPLIGRNAEQKARRFSRTIERAALWFDCRGSVKLQKIWWTRPGSNRRPPRCERGALPAELLAHVSLGVKIIPYRVAAIPEFAGFVLKFWRINLKPVVRVLK
jgi:hypothetical protein